MSPRTWGKLTLGVLVIGGTLAVVWAVYGSRGPGPGEPAVVTGGSGLPLNADAMVRVHEGAGTRRASITCAGDRSSASGFWAAHAKRACEALASTRDALLSGPGCPAIGQGQVGLTATGSFGDRRFSHRAVRDGCPDVQGWLDVNVLAAPVLEPDQELQPVGGG